MADLPPGLLKMMNKKDGADDSSSTEDGPVDDGPDADDAPAGPTPEQVNCAQDVMDAINAGSATKLAQALLDFDTDVTPPATPEAPETEE